MSPRWNRRDVLRGLAVASTVIIVSPKLCATQDGRKTAALPVEIQITPVSPHTFRLTILLLDKNGLVESVPSDGSLVQDSSGTPIAKLRAETEQIIAVGNVRLKISLHPVKVSITNEGGNAIQQLGWDDNSGALSFLIGDSPLFGLGEGGPQFDRRGSVDLMRTGQGGYKLATHGARVPVPWIIGTSGWAMFIHQPFGTFDLRGPEG